MSTIIIRQEQMTRFRALATDRHAEQIRRFLGERYPTVVAEIAPETALERIRWGLRAIGALGVTDGRVAALFVVAQFIAGPTFYRHPSCVALFANRRLPPNARVDAVFHADSAIPWDEIKTDRDDQAWLSGACTGLER
jgi:hypothetical protein